MEESMRIAAPMTENGNLVMMVFSYWDQACAFVNYGLLHEELFFETNGEFFGVWERVKPIVPKCREMFKQKLFLANLELGYLHPPVGQNLFLSSLRFNKPVSTVFVAVIPMLLVFLFGVILITYVPPMTTALPHWFGH